MSMFAKVRRLFHRDNLSISEIQRRTSLSRNTIKAWLKETRPDNCKYPKRPKINGKLTPFVPSLLLLYGNDDDTVRPFNIESLTKKIKQAGGCVETHYYDGLDHASLTGAAALPLQNGSSVLGDIAGFLDRHAHNRRSC